MGLLGWILYIILGFLFFFVIQYLQNRYNLSKIEKLVFSIILMLVSAGFCVRFGFQYIDNFFLVFVFQMIAEVIYSSYFVERDFFDKTEKNVVYYILLVVLGFFINQHFINTVQQVFLTGEDFRILLWAFVIVFLYQFCNKREVFATKEKEKNHFMSHESVLTQYAKLKYQFYDECNVEDRELSNLLYAIMIFQNHKRSKILRQYDYFIFRLNGNKRKLGIMQVMSRKFISDSESISLTYQELLKLQSKKESRSKTVKSVKTKTIEEVIYLYDKENASYIQYIFDIIKKF